MSINLSYQLQKEATIKRTIAGSISYFFANVKEFTHYIEGDGFRVILTFIAVIINSLAGVLTPFLVAKAVDDYIAKKDIQGLAYMMLGLGILYGITVIAGYIQGRLMGGVAQRTLFRLRTALFEKIQSLPIAFFNQNKAGDLISRINNDTDKLNQFLSESITRFVGNFAVLFGIAVFVLYINLRLGLVMLASTLVLVVVTRLLSPWIERENRKNLDAVGELSASLQENLTNFRAIAAYGRRDYFRNHLLTVNETTFETAKRAGAANRVFEPIYDFAGNAALIVVIAYGLYLVNTNIITIGILIAFISYTQKFYDPLRILATIFGNIQLSLAAWSRIRDIFFMKNMMEVCGVDTAEKVAPDSKTTYPRIEFRNVNFKFEDSDLILENINASFEVGKTYALVGPTGGGKSTLANLMSRLFDPTSGTIFLDGKALPTYSAAERARKVSVILQDPIIFSGTVGDNIRYGNDAITGIDDAALERMLIDRGLADVIERFDKGLATEIGQNAALSIGQKQLVSFMRTVLRAPELLILDEATANIDTVTEAILEKALAVLPHNTTKVIIAHRLNTIKEADQILFVNNKHVTLAGTFEEALSLITHAKRTS